LPASADGLFAAGVLAGAGVGLAGAGVGFATAGVDAGVTDVFEFAEGFGVAVGFGVGVGVTGQRSSPLGVIVQPDGMSCMNGL
jgi:hypothetical protein